MHSLQILIGLLAIVATLAFVTKRFLILRDAESNIGAVSKKKAFASYAAAVSLVLAGFGLVALMLYVFYFEK